MKKSSTAVTIYDVAREAGCSPMTVSRALKGDDGEHGHPGRKLRYERIRKIARKLNYKPNQVARALSRQHTGQVGFCVNHPGFDYYHPYQFYTLASMKARLMELGYQLGFYYFRPAGDPEFEEFLRPPTACDAIVFSGTNFCGEELDAIRQSGIRAISLREEIAGIPSVTVNEYRGGQLAAEAFHQEGHRRVGILWRSQSRVDSRAIGFLERAAELGLEVPEGSNIQLFNTPATESIHNRNAYLFNEESVGGMKRLLSQRSPVTGVFISSDFMAFPMVQYLDEAGIALGGDLSVISFDNFEELGEAPWGTPRLTSIDVPRTEIGRIAAELLVDSLKLGRTASIRLEPTLINRSSLAAPASHPTRG